MSFLPYLFTMIPGFEESLDDLVVPGAAAKIAGDTLLNLGFGWLRIFFEQLRARHQESRCAVATLYRTLINKCCLNGVQFALVAQPFDRDDLRAVRAWGSDHAGHY